MSPEGIAPLVFTYVEDFNSENESAQEFKDKLLGTNSNKQLKTNYY